MTRKGRRAARQSGPAKANGSQKSTERPKGGSSGKSRAGAIRPETEAVLTELKGYGDSFEKHSGLPFQEQTLRNLVDYVAELFRWNDRTALLSRGDEARIVERHIMDSLSLLAFLHETEGMSLLDIGSGAGFPGIPLKIAAPGLAVTLVESIHKKQLFLRHVIQKLGLKDASVLEDRVENGPWEAETPGGFDVVTCRATLSLSDLAIVGGAAAKPGGTLVAYKGGRYADELSQAEGTIAQARLDLMAVWESPWGPGRLLAFCRVR